MILKYDHIVVPTTEQTSQEMSNIKRNDVGDGSYSRSYMNPISCTT